MLFAGDLKGNISIYKSDSHYRPVPIAHFQEKFKAITDVCFSTLLYSEESTDPRTGIKVQMEQGANLFFYAACTPGGSGEGGSEASSSVHFCSSRGHSGTALDLGRGNRMECMILHDGPAVRQRRIVTLTAGLMLSVYQEAVTESSSYEVTENWQCTITMKLAGAQTPKNLATKLKMLSAGSESMIICR